MEDNFIIELTYKSIFPDIKTYYELNSVQLDIFEQWYDIFDIVFYNGVEISRDLLEYKLVETKDDIVLAKQFIDVFGRPFEILEEIDELSELFTSCDTISDNSSENSCYDETETINTIIKAHFDGDVEKVKDLLGKINIDDDIIDDLKLKYY